MVHIEDQSGVVLATGTSVLTRPLIAFVGRLPAQVTKVYGSSAKIKQVVIPQSIREVRFRVDKQPYQVKLSTARTLEEQMGELSTVLNHLGKKGSSPSLYIDLRIKNKAFYK